MASSNKAFALDPFGVHFSNSRDFNLILFAVMDGSSQTELERRQSPASSAGGSGEAWSMLTVVLMGAALTLAVITTVVGLIARMGRRPPGGRGAASATRTRYDVVGEKDFLRLLDSPLNIGGESRSLKKAFQQISVNAKWIGNYYSCWSFFPSDLHSPATQYALRHAG